MTQALFHVPLQRVVGRDARRRLRLRLGRIASIRNTEVDVPTFEGLQVRLPVRQGSRRERTGIAKNRVAVSIVLLERRTWTDRVSWRRNTRLVERYGNDFVAAEITHVPNLDHEIVTRLPLNVQRLVHGIGQLVR